MNADFANPAQRVIFVNRYFYPDLSGTSQMLSDLAFALANVRFEVMVIASRHTYDDANALLPAVQIVDGVRVERVWSTRFGRTSRIGRLVDYMTFHVFAAIRLARLARPNDVVVAKTDPPLISVPAWLISRWRRAKLVNWLQDLFPEVLAVELGRRPYWLRLLEGLRNRSLRAAHKNVVLGKHMATRLNAAGIAAGLVSIIENWSDDERVRPIARVENALRRDWDLGGKFVVGYSGNLGVAHEFETILEAATLLRDRRDIAFLFVGGGGRLPLLKRRVAERKLQNFKFCAYQPTERLAQSLSVPDVHVVSLRPEMEGLVVPSKIYGVMAAGRPTIFVGDLRGEIAGILEESACGIAICQGDAGGLAAAISGLSFSNDECHRMGRAARAAFALRYERRIAVEKWTKLIASL
jgi:colanic acid biosynthesis glycosyl transferase WcaI